MKSTLRLDKLLAHAGFGTRSNIKQLVRSGAVIVDGKQAKDSGLQIDPVHAEISVNGVPVRYREYVYLMMNKPQGVVSATEDARDRTVLDLLDEAYRHLKLFPVGRLDKDTEGLLLLTNDGRLAHNLLSPRRHVPKTYNAEVEGRVDDTDIGRFAEGVRLDDGYVTLPAKLAVLDDGRGAVSRIELVIHEGKFHQVKRMFAAVGKKVLFLKRMAMGPLQLDDKLAPGGYRELTDTEIEGLKNRDEL